MSDTGAAVVAIAADELEWEIEIDGSAETAAWASDIVAGRIVAAVDILDVNGECIVMVAALEGCIGQIADEIVDIAMFVAVLIAEKIVSNDSGGGQGGHLEQ